MAGQHLITSEEAWKPIPDFPGYEISDYGRVRSYWKIMSMGRGKGTKSIIMPYPQRINKPYCHPDKYATVNLWKNRQQFKVSIHRLVLKTFIGLSRNGGVCRHLDGNKFNNKLTNLCWGTQKENAVDRLDQGTMKYGRDLYNTKLTDEQIIKIRQMAIEGVLHKEIAVMFGVSRSHISSIIKGRRRKSL